jgi:hypothetical protein
LFLAYVDWNEFEEFVVRILRRARTPEAADIQSSVTATEIPPAAEPTPAAAAGGTGEAKA